MQALEWSPSLALGHADVDKSHQAILAALAKLQHGSACAFHDNLGELMFAMRAGFDEEEQLMRTIAFPELEPHRRQHQRILSMLTHIAMAQDSADLEASRAIIDLLPRWFLFHLSSMDLPMSIMFNMLETAGECG